MPDNDSAPEAPLGAEEVAEQVERVVHSSVFRNSSLLQAFLRFICEKDLAGDPQRISEYAIAAEVFKRGRDFDPSSETVVRTHAYRLRQKLKEYYEGQGGDDPVTIEIPKGHYVPVFSRRAAAAYPAIDDDSLNSPALHPAGSERKPGMAANRLQAPQPRRRFRWRWVAAASLAAVAAAAFFLARAPRTPQVSAQNRSGAQEAVWSHFLHSDVQTIVAFHNNVFLVTPQGHMVRFYGSASHSRGTLVDPREAGGIRWPGLGGPFAYEDGFTGTGEMHAVHRLTEMFAAANSRLLVKRSRSLVADDLKNHNVIVLGWSSAVFQELSLPLSLRFETSPDVNQTWTSRLTDLGAPGGKPISYTVERSRQNGALQTDYAAFCLLPGVTPRRKIMILAGLTTSGTQGAAEFATSRDELSSMLQALGGARDRPPDPAPLYFESVLRVQTARGLDALSVQCVSARRLSAPDPAVGSKRREAGT